jgi:hypothetical protein
MAYLVMLLAVLLSMVVALLAHVPLHCGVDEQLLSYRVSGKLPGELVAIPSLVIDTV